MERRAEIAKRVRMARAGADMTLRELAEKVSADLGYEVSYEILRRIEHGDRAAEIEVLEAIASITGEPVDFVFGKPYDRLAIPGSLKYGRRHDDYASLGLVNPNLSYAHGAVTDLVFEIADRQQRLFDSAA